MYTVDNCCYGGERLLRKLLNKLWRKPQAGANDKKSSSQANKISGKIRKDEKLLRETYQNCDDVKFRKVIVPAMGMREALIVYTDGLINSDRLNRDVIERLQDLNNKGKQVKDVTYLLATGEIHQYSYLNDFQSEILLGRVAVIVDGIAKAFLLDNRDWPMRGIEEPLQERLVRGPREGFTEVFRVNLGLIRRRLPDPNLKIIENKVGRRSMTKVGLVYLEDVCNLDTVAEVEERVKAIDIDGMLESGTMSELITERSLTPFPMMLSTERPDKVVASLLSGKIAIVSDGSPFVLILPVTSVDFFHNPEDYYMNPLYAFFARLTRFTGLFMGTTLTAAYTAVITFHYEMIPRDLVIFIAQTREGIPFNPITEALLLEGAVELLREASVRLPAPIGSTLGIVGALILGQAAADAHLVSPILLIIVAISFLSSSSIPNYEAGLALRFLRFPILIAAGVL